MQVRLRPGTSDDAEACGRIVYEAFKSICDQHNFPLEIPSVEAATGLVTMSLANPGMYSVVAELDGRIVGSNFLDERSVIAGIGVVTVDPSVMNVTIGRQLMQDVLDRAAQRNFPGVRLVQIAWHYRSLALYTKLGFDTRETLSVMQGPPLDLKIDGYEVRPAREADVPACNQLCRRVHGHDRGGHLLDAIPQGAANVVERQGKLTGYCTGIGFFHHAVAETNDDLAALIGAATTFDGPGFLLPSRNGELFRWCLSRGLRIAEQATLMTIGLYNEPAGAYLPSISY
ncbi:MAG: GNAT family N-acetyltransferase [Actinomycetota bacterium]|nr:GNAT family N-acetyltransferase [Actinomycetota bacterium]